MNARKEEPLVWMANRQDRDRLREPPAELGKVTISGSSAGVALEGERRKVTLCGPGGYHWAPARGDTVLVVKSGPEERPCIAGAVEEADLAPGEVYLSVAPDAGIRLKPDGTVALQGAFRLEGSLEVTGSLRVNGREVE